MTSDFVCWLEAVFMSTSMIPSFGNKLGRFQILQLQGLFLNFLLQLVDFLFKLCALLFSPLQALGMDLRLLAVYFCLTVVECLHSVV